MKLRVFGWNRGGTQRAIVATSSFKAAAEVAGQSLGSFRSWCSVTSNAEEIKVATTSPGIVFYRPLDKHGMDVWRALE